MMLMCVMYISMESIINCHSLAKQAEGPLKNYSLYTLMCGPMSTTSLNDSMYFLLFIDDITRMTWEFFLRKKSSVFAAF